MMGRRKRKTFLAFCNSCGKYTEHVYVAPNIIECLVCGHKQREAWNDNWKEVKKE